MPESFGCSERHFNSKVDTEKKSVWGGIRDSLVFRSKNGPPLLLKLYPPCPYKAQQTLLGSFAITLSWLTDLGSKKPGKLSNTPPSSH